MYLTNKVKFSKSFYENYKRIRLITGVYGTSVTKLAWHMHIVSFIRDSKISVQINKVLLYDKSKQTGNK